MKNIKNIIFDFDGVLADNIDLLKENHNKHLGYISEEEHRKIFDGNPTSKLKEYDKKQLENYWEEWEQVFLKLIINQNVKTFLEESLKANKTLYIITSNSENNIKQFIKNNKIQNIFSQILGKETNYSKIEKFKILDQDKNFNFNETIFITDSMGDLIEANNFPEMKTMGVTFGIHCRKRLESENPDFIVDSWEEIKNILLK